MAAVHDDDRARPASVCCIDQLAALADILSDALDRRRLRADNGNQARGGDEIAKSNSDELPFRTSFHILQLLADLLDLGFKLNNDLGERCIAAL